MLLTIPSTPGASNRWIRAATILTRAAAGLLLHALMRPFRPAVISRRTGKVAAR